MSKETKAPERKDEITKWPFVRWIESRSRWMVDGRTKTGGKRQFFETKAEAMGCRANLLVASENEGNAAFDDTELRKFGWTIAKAIDFTLDHLRRTAQSKLVSDAVNELIEFKRPRVNPARLSDLKTRLNRFAASCEGKTLAQVTDADVLAFLETIPHPTTRNDYRKEVIMLWIFAKSRKWVLETIDTKAVPGKSNRTRVGRF